MSESGKIKMFIQHIKRFINVIKTQGLGEALVRMIQRMLSFVIALFVILIWPFKKIRLIRLRSARIGHFADNVHLLLCALKYNTYPEEKNCAHFYYTQTYVPISNSFLYKMWSRVIKIVPPWGAFWSYVDDILIMILKEKYRTPFKKIFEDSIGGYDIWNYHRKGKNQFIFFTEEEKQMGENLKVKLGIPDGKPFVCLMVRDAAYIKNVMPDTAIYDENFRNADIKNYIPAIRFLIQKGYYVIRMGKYVEKALNIEDPRFIDYSNHPIKSDFMDIYLSGTCAFFIGTSSGLDSVPRIMNRPVVTTNAIFFQEKSYVDWTFLIFKNLFCIKTQTLVSYREIFKDYAHFILSGKYTNHRDPIIQEWERKNWVFIENTPDEILDVVKEMVDYLENPAIETHEMRDLQLLFWKNMPYELGRGETSYESVTMRISPSFLKRHDNLITKFTSQACEVN